MAMFLLRRNRQGVRVRLARTIHLYVYTVYIRNFRQGNHHIYGHIRCRYMVLANLMCVLYTVSVYGSGLCACCTPYVRAVHPMCVLYTLCACCTPYVRAVHPMCVLYTLCACCTPYVRAVHGVSIWFWPTLCACCTPYVRAAHGVSIWFWPTLCACCTRRQCESAKGTQHPHCKLAG